MPFRSLYREQMTAAEFQTPGSLCIMHPDYDQQDHRQERYHETEFNYPPSHLTTQALTSPLISKYPTTMDMDDDLSYLRHGRLEYLADAASTTSAAGLSDNSRSYGHMLGMSGQQSGSTSTPRTDSMAESSASEPSMSSANPIGTSAEEQICPLITGETGTCQPDRCGPNAPCMNFANIQSIEECAQVPCLMSPVSEKLTLSDNHKRDSMPPRSSQTKKSAAENTPKQLSKADVKRRAKQAHSLVEKKYRENLNAKMCQLHETLKVTRYGPKRHHREIEENDSDDFSGTNSKFRKGDVLDDALDYVNQTEVEMRHMEAEIHRLSDIVGMLERRIKFDAARSNRGVMMPMSMQVRPV